MKTVICNVPLRSEDRRTVYPPLGAMYVTQALLTAGYEAYFYDINYFRPSLSDIERYFSDRKPEVVGISATVSTSYANLKKTVAVIRKVLPNSMIVVGGAITASSDIVLKFTQTDICCVGEGEQVMVNLVKCFAQQGFKKNDSELQKIPGICFLNSQGEMVFTGYEVQIPMTDVPDPDYELLKRDSQVEGYIISPFYYEQFKHDSRALELRRKNKNMATVVTSRGCVARCTFCHRWQKGIRIFTVDRVIAHIRFLMEQYNVGFISFGDEDFGASEKWTLEFIEKIARLDILYRIGAIRVDHISLSLLKSFRDSGCVAIHYGFESGSDKILKVMEKRTTADMNADAAIWTYQGGLQTVPALVVGMPGESFETIEETAQFLKKITEFYPYVPVVSPNLLVALPGTPVYEYARHKGFLGKTLADEECYLLRVSDHGGGTEVHFNFTDYPYFMVQAWVRCLIISVLYHYFQKREPHVFSVKNIFKNFYHYMTARDKTSLSMLMAHPWVHRFRYAITFVYIVLHNLKHCPWSLFAERCVEVIVWPFKKKTFTEYMSLRRYMDQQVKNIKEIKLQTTNPMLLKWGR